MNQSGSAQNSGWAKVTRSNSFTIEKLTKSYRHFCKVGENESTGRTGVLSAYS